MLRFGNARTKVELEEQLQSYDRSWWARLPDKGALNAYKCQTCGKIIFTVDMDKGTTPMFMGCKASETCKGNMVSSGYPSAPPPKGWQDNYPVWEWYRPEVNALGLFHEDQVIDEYVRRGGLLLRKREK